MHILVCSPGLCACCGGVRMRLGGRDGTSLLWVGLEYSTTAGRRSTLSHEEATGSWRSPCEPPPASRTRDGERTAEVVRRRTAPYYFLEAD